MVLGIWYSIKTGNQLLLIGAVLVGAAVLIVAAKVAGPSENTRKDFIPLVSPWKKREIFHHGLKWQPEAFKLPMHLEVRRWQQQIVGGSFLLPGIIFAVWGLTILAQAVGALEIGLLVTGAGFSAIGIAGSLYALKWD